MNYVCIIFIPFLLVGMTQCLNKILQFFRNLRRWHIGRWNSEAEWQKAINFCGEKWILHPPLVPSSDDECSLGSKKNDTLQSWQNAGLALGLLEYSGGKKSDALKKWESGIVQPDGTWKNSLNRVDWAMTGYAFLRVCDHPEKYRSAADQILNVIKKNLCKDGMISYSLGPESSVRFVDTLGMVCPFLALYGRIYKELEISEMAYHQIECFHQSGLYKGTQLPCHAYDSKENLPLGVYGWGRGTAWYIIALLDVWKELPCGKQKETLQCWMKEAADEYAEFQTEDGGFQTILQGGGQYDSSVTAAMALFYKRCGGIFQDERYNQISKKCISRLMKATMRDGAIDQCQGDTHGIGIFSQRFDIMPFAQGLALRAAGSSFE